MEKERRLLEKRLEESINKRRKLEDIQIGLIQLNRDKANILVNFSEAWQGQKADQTMSRLEDAVEEEWRETRKYVNALEDEIIEEKRQIRIQLDKLKENPKNGAH
ncbi:hypothetical protein BMT55_06770 [Listeria newyorkensis]|uniref:DUF5082 domain-containing protein n=1 Tax=Listeria newyorkensis TaxID=1497681 RepID=A0ABX4XQX5_9LIST|nr:MULTISPECIES: hypothetical protein [Listeria]KGL39574.1 hypothetical protein EP56_13505 [Listeriaceae bacterium FSL A5-0209]KGL44154.1 hypothetical protein EP58_06820 [Listeria newyorkensis]PNP93123.1 hypothetical protein BMT55_06770 [Listeria newyorkensis]RQW67120.1 hypothetical protein DUK53_07980 [Listeria sp. SHR_NRA_18]SQC57749.1 Uncharacterised protein [Listeria newyorkensis]